MKLIKEIRDKIISLFDDIAAQLGLQHRPVPVRVKNNKNRKLK